MNILRSSDICVGSVLSLIYPSPVTSNAGTSVEERNMSRQNLPRNLHQPASPSDGRRYGVQSPRTPASPTIEQLLHSDAVRWSASNSPTSPGFGRDHDLEDDHTPLHKKSILAKVKERAKRWRQNLGKKKQSQDGNATPSWGVSLDEYEEEDDGGPDGDPEYLGAPMYESEMAPEGLKETARQHPRAVPVISEKHTLPSSAVEDANIQEKLNPPNSPKQKASDNGQVTSPSKTLTESVTEKLQPAYDSVTEKLAPAYATLSETTHNIAAKIQGLTVSTPSEEPGLTEQTDQKNYDKGVSVKEYLYQKFEPGEDEKALSKAITEAISPKKSPDGKGVVDKVREAVSSLLRAEEEAAPSKSTAAVPSASSAAVSSIRTVTPPPSVTPRHPSTHKTLTPPTHTTLTPATRTATAFPPALSTNSRPAPATHRSNAANPTTNYPASSFAHEGTHKFIQK
uniref:Uncharacterized protein n=1 Tax=Kalanchoe fedtschenkoi TaxID=63787 RepID=A0A7N0UK77_KALFE